MPEGPEVEVVRRSLAKQLEGETIGTLRTSGLDLRGRKLRARDVARLRGSKVKGVLRHGKLLFVETNAGGLVVQLGMTGRLLVVDDKFAAPHTHLDAQLTGGRRLVYVDPRRFGEVTHLSSANAWRERIASLGPDVFALSRAPAHKTLVGALARTQRRLKDAVLDQRTVAGVGNIYACEALFMAKLPVELRGREARPDELERLVRALYEEARRGLRHGGTSFRDFVDGQGRAGRHQNHLHVFLREGRPCPVCAKPVVRGVVSGRGTFWCPQCQKRRRR